MSTTSTSILDSLGTLAAHYPYATNSTYNTWPQNLITSLMEPQFTIKLVKAENGGFVILVNTNGPLDPANLSIKSPKVYINSNVENLGKDIQNALLLDLLKA